MAQDHSTLMWYDTCTCFPLKVHYIDVEELFDLKKLKNIIDRKKTGDFMCHGRVRRSFSACGNRHVAHVSTKQVISLLQ